MNKNGFSLIELLVVMLIISFLVGIAISGSIFASKYSFDQNVKTQTLQITNYLEDYFSVFNYYPTQGCGTVGNGFDKLGNLPLPTVFSNLTFSSIFPQDYSEYKGLLSEISVEGAKFGYCTASNTQRTPLAYILAVQTRLGSICTDANGNNYYAFGAGIFQLTGYEHYYSIATINRLPLVGVNYSIQCFGQ